MTTILNRKPPASAAAERLKLPRFPSASKEEIDALKRLVKKSDTSLRSSVIAPKPTQELPPGPPPVSKVFNKDPSRELFAGGINYAQVTREPLQIDNPVQWLLMLMPELRPYKWQFETLMATAGYLTPGKYSKPDKSAISDAEPLRLLIAAANGSGKDMILIAGFATWFAVKHVRNRVIITSSSFEQVKFQTEVHIRNLVTRANRRFGTLFKSTQFHHIVPELGGEIKLFATDEPGKAEGYHPFEGGEMAIIINEAKSVREPIFEALNRCSGYSHWLEVSSPGPRSGHMFRQVSRAQMYPNQVELGRFYLRRITAFECPHLTAAYIRGFVDDYGENSILYRSAILAEFTELDTSVVIPENVYDKAFLNPPPAAGDDIGIGLDLAAGGDEDACWVRKGNRIIHQFFFRQKDTDLACDLIDAQLSPWKDAEYTFRADNGGIGQGMIDQLVKRGWRVQRRNNQSPANKKREFLNLGAEMWFHTKRLLERLAIIVPHVDKLKEQLTTRFYRGFDSTQGRLALESKQEAKLSGRVSPDRADGFVLCFSSYYPSLSDHPKETPSDQKLITGAELVKLWSRGRPQPITPTQHGRFTILTGRI